MKKFMLLASVMALLAVSVQAGGFISLKVIADTNTTSITTADVLLSGSGKDFRDVSEFAFKNSSTGIVSATLYSINMLDATAIATLANIAPGTTAYTFPRRQEVSAINAMFTAGAASNTTYVTNFVPYKVRTARVIYTMPAHTVPVTNWYQIKAE